MRYVKPFLLIFLLVAGIQAGKTQIDSGVSSQNHLTELKKLEKILNEQRQAIKSAKCEHRAEKLVKKARELEDRYKANNLGTRKFNRKARRVGRKAQRLLRTCHVSFKETSDSTCTCKNYLLGRKCVCKGNKRSYRPCDLYNCLASIYKVDSCSSDDCHHLKGDRVEMEDFERLLAAVNKSLTISRSSLAYLNAENEELAKADKNQPNALDAKKTGTVQINKQNNSKLDSIELKIRCMQQDSTDLANCIMGRQSFKMGNVSVFQNFPSLPDDNPVNVTQLFFGYSLPLNKLKGKLVCNYNLPYTFIWFRNFYMTTSFTPFNSSSRYFIARDTTLSAYNAKTPYVNLLDLYQFSRFTFNGNLNIVTFTSRYYSVYLNAHAGLGRTWLLHNGDTSRKTNFLVYGINSSIKSKFNIPLNMVFTYRLFTIDPNSNIVQGGLNPQFENLRHDPDVKPVVNNTNNQLFTSFNLTFQYSMSKEKAATEPGSSARSSSSPAFFYFQVGYNTNKVFGRRYGLAYNNYFILQVGYSRELSSFFDGVRSLLGIKD